MHELWIDSVIGSRKFDEARKHIDEWIETEPKSGHAINTASELRHAEGDWLEAYALALKAIQADPCIPDAYEAMADFEVSAGYPATAHKHLALAHQLAPNDDNIRLAWIGSFDEKTAIEQYKDFMQTKRTVSEARRKKIAHALETESTRTENNASSPRCRVPRSSPWCPFKIRAAWALTITASRSPSTATNAFCRLTPARPTFYSPTVPRPAQVFRTSTSPASAVSATTAASGGIISKASTVQIGGLQFKNCTVRELNGFGAMGGDLMGMGAPLDSGDGLVGSDIFSRYLLTVDYMKHQLRLEPLPTPPGAAAASVDALGGLSDPNAALADRFVAPSMRSWTSIYREGHDLIVPARVNSKLIRLFILDTGANSNLVDTTFAAQITSNKSSMSEMRGLSGAVKKMGETGSFVSMSQICACRSTAWTRQIFPSSTELPGSLVIPRSASVIDYRDNLMLLEAPLAQKH